MNSPPFIRDIFHILNKVLYNTVKDVVQVCQAITRQASSGRGDRWFSGRGPLTNSLE